MNISQVIALAVAAIVGTVGLIKPKLIEELVKKFTSDGKNAKAYSILFMIIVVIGLGLFPVFFPELSVDSASEEIVQAETPNPLATTQKSDLEVKVEAVKEGIGLTKDLVTAAKENRERKDSIFAASKSERWVVQINDWTDDEDRILDIYKSLPTTDNVKLLKVKKHYLFVREDQMSKQQLEIAFDSLTQILSGFRLKLYNLNDVTTRRKDKLIERQKTFGKRKNKVTIQCLTVD